MKPMTLGYSTQTHYCMALYSTKQQRVRVEAEPNHNNRMQDKSNTYAGHFMIFLPQSQPGINITTKTHMSTRGEKMEF